MPEYLFEVGPECFLPAPKVTSAVVRLTPRTEPPQALVEEEQFFRVVRVAFAQRRKTLLNGLSSAFGDRLDREAASGPPWRRPACPTAFGGSGWASPEFAVLAAALQSRL